MSLFQVYDGPGPIRRQDMTRDVLKPQMRVLERDAARAVGLYVVHTAPVRDLQTDALRTAPSVTWSVT